MIHDGGASKMYTFGLIGYPIKHSLSPWIHESFLASTDVKGSYSIIEIDPAESFSKNMQLLKEKNLNGFNITVPFKQSIIPFLDELDEEAKRIGAVNTVVHKDGKWIGYNTDGKGYVRSLMDKYPALESEKELSLLMIGAGGAARGIYYALLAEGFTNIDITNRTLASAQELTEFKPVSANTNIKTLKDAEETLSDYDVVIQTTSVGMKPHEGTSIMSLDKLKASCIVSDIVYQPIKTRFLTEAESKGALLHFGHTMLLYQAQLAFEIWTNKNIELVELETALRLQLEG